MNVKDYSMPRFWRDVIAWGYNGSGQTTVPVEATNGATEIAAGGWHSLALKNGEVIAWGDDTYGQSTVPAGATSDVTAIAAASWGWHSLALKNGGVIAWGYNDSGQTTVPAEATSGVSAISAGGRFSLALKNGGVIAWGYNGSGQTTVPAEATSGVSAISAGGWHCLALKNGGVIGWGLGGQGETTVPAEATSGVTAISAGNLFSLALKNGEVIGWGHNTSGETTVPAEATSGVSAISAGKGFSLALKNGGVIAWGTSWWGITTIPAEASEGVEAIAAGGGHSLVLSSQPSSQSSSSISSLSTSSLSSMSGSSGSSSSSSSSRSSRSSSQSQWYDKIKDAISIIINPLTGNPFVVCLTEKNHLLIEERDSLYKNLLKMKFLPKKFNNGNLFILQNDPSEIPFSFESVDNRETDTLLPFSYGSNTEFDANAFLNPNNKNNVIFTPLDSKKEVIIPHSYNSTYTNTVSMEIWNNDVFEIKNVKVGNLYNMSFSTLNKPKTSYNLPSFSWEHNSVLSNERFNTLQKDGKLNLLEYDEKILTNTKSISCLTSNNSLNFDFSNLVYSFKDKNIYVVAADSIIKINSSDFEIIDIHHRSHINLYCYDDNGNLWGVINSKNIIKIDENFNETIYEETISHPIKMVFSLHHNSIFMMSNNILYKFNILDSKISIIDQVEQYSFKDIDIFIDGSIAISLYDNQDNNKSIIKIFNPDFTIKQIFNFTDQKISKLLFYSQGILFYLLEKDNSSFVSHLDIDKKQNIYSNSFDKIDNVAFLHSSALKLFFVFSSDGKIFNFSDNIKNDEIKINKIYDLKRDVSNASIGLPRTYQNQLKQEKVRVFVGSRVGQNDRWDSGEITSNKTEILYGGGNNLEAGQKYFVHIIIYYKDYGWSNVQIKEFVVPK